jgi:hypothetical protein
MRMAVLQATKTLSSPSRGLLGDAGRSVPYSIRLQNVSADAFGALLTFIYTGEIALTAASAVDIFVAADRFDITPLRRRAELFLPRCLTVSNVAGFLMKACKLQQLQLAAYFSAFIARHFDAFLESPGFLTLPQSVLRALLSSPNVCVENEGKVSAVSSVETFPLQRGVQFSGVSGCSRRAPLVADDR